MTATGFSRRRMRAVKQYHDVAGMMIRVGDVVDAKDEFVKANPELFAREAA